MKSLRIFILAVCAMTAFSANSLLCRLALKHVQIDAASFTSIRILSGAISLGIIARIQGKPKHLNGNWISAFALFLYATTFSFAYVTLSAGTGALLLFGAVQTTMILYSLSAGERLNKQQSWGLVLAIFGLIAFMLPGVTAPSVIGTILMIVAGIAWGVYSLRGKESRDPLGVTNGNFLRAVPFAIGLSLMQLSRMQMNPNGIVLAILSGAIASGIGYAIWYQVVSETRTSSAAIMQLSVPVIAALGGLMILGEILTSYQLFFGTVILGGIAMMTISRKINPKDPISSRERKKN